MAKRPGAIKRSRRATDKAYSRWSRALDYTFDTDVSLYRSLSKSDLQELAKEFGTENVIAYVEEMERRQLKRGGENGG